ncbi:MAG: hypothetical protein H0U76_21765 [Ktedonobacteraceae bacterium]|nr:hypothetical protein [Ktedonobacteraceae bacterium]
MEQQLKEGVFAPFHLTILSETVPGVDGATVLLKMAKDGHIEDEIAQFKQTNVCMYEEEADAGADSNTSKKTEGGGILRGESDTTDQRCEANVMSTTHTKDSE